MLAAEIEPAFAAGRNRRRSPREPVSLDTDIDRDGLERALCRLADLSRSGARLQTYSPLKRGATMWLTLPTLGVRAVTITWVKDFLAGCQFAEALTPGEFDLLLDLDETLRPEW
jgi:hypothetical protein